MHAQLLTTLEPLDTGSLLAGRYCILAKVGEGGFGVIYNLTFTNQSQGDQQ